MTNEHTSLEKYTSHILFERVVCERWVGDWTDCNILTPNSSIFSSTFFSFCWLFNRGPEGPALCWEQILTASNCNSNSNCNWLQLTQLSVAPGYMIVWRSPASCGVAIAPNSTRPRSRWYPDIFHRMNLLFTQVPLLIDSSAEGQYATPVVRIIKML